MAEDDAGMTAHPAGTTPAEIETYEQLLDAIDRLRICGARGHQKLRLSIRDVASSSGVPRSSVATYLTGRVIMPYDQFNAIVTSLGITEDQQPGWEGAWRRAYHERTSPPRAPLTLEDKNTPPKTGDGGLRIGTIRSEHVHRNLALLVMVACAVLVAATVSGFEVARPRQQPSQSVRALTTSSFPYPLPSPGRRQRCSAPIADTDGACVGRDSTYIYADFYATAAKSWALTLEQCSGDGTHCIVIAATSEATSLAWPAAPGHNYRALASWTDRNGRRHAQVGSPAISVPIPR